MKRAILRALFALAAGVGLVAVTAGTAAAGISLNHAEPHLDAQRK
jgi:hypothetical protein